MNRRFLLHGALPTIASALLLALMGAAVKYTSQDLPNTSLVFMRNAAGLLWLIPMVLWQGVHVLRTDRLFDHLMRATFGLSAMYCFFYSIGHIGLAQATLLNSTAPLFIPFLGFIFLKEQPGPILFGAVTIGFIGVAFLLNPTLQIQDGAKFGLLAGFFVACAKICVRHLSSSEPVIRTVFYFACMGTLISLVPMLMNWQTPTLTHLGVMLFAGLAGTIGQLLLTYAYTHAPASRVAPYSYAFILFSAILGWVFWGEILDSYTIIGAILIILAGILASHKNSMKSQTSGQNAVDSDISDTEKIK